MVNMDQMAQLVLMLMKPYNANVNNRNNEAQIGRVLVGDKKAIRVEFEYAGENYTTGAIAISGAGAGAAVTLFSDGAVKHIDVILAGDNYPALHSKCTRWKYNKCCTCIK